MVQSSQLLLEYYQSGDEAAFAELVRQELDLVYSTALRKLGDPELAKDASQIVFADLVRRAELLSRISNLSGWLYRHTGFVTAKLRRHEARRRQREAKAMQPEEQEHTGIQTASAEEIMPLLDWAMGRLKESDREVLVLRFLGGRTVQEVGRVLGITENAARMRIDRALARTRSVLSKRGVISSSAAVTAALAVLTSPAPAGLAAGVAASALAAKASASLLSVGSIQLLTHMTMTKAAAGIAAIAIAVAITSSVLKQHQVERLRRENADLLRQNSEMADMRARNQQLEKLQVDADELARLRMERGELFRLRGELGLLRQRLGDLQNSQSKSGTVAAASAAVQPQPGGDVAPGFYQADSWINQGFISPQSSAMTFFWSLRGGHAQEYSESLGKTNLQSLPVEWAHALADIKGSQFSETLSSEEGGPMVGLLHEMKDGSTQNTWLTLTNVDGKWRIKSIIGYPIVVHELNTVSGP